MSAEPRFPELIVDLTTGGGNIYAIGANVTKGLRELRRYTGRRYDDEIAEFQTALSNSPSYEAALDVVRQWVRVENDPREDASSW